MINPNRPTSPNCTHASREQSCSALSPRHLNTIVQFTLAEVNRFFSNPLMDMREASGNMKNMRRLAVPTAGIRGFNRSSSDENIRYDNSNSNFNSSGIQNRGHETHCAHISSSERTADVLTLPKHSIAQETKTDLLTIQFNNTCKQRIREIDSNVVSNKDQYFVPLSEVSALVDHCKSQARFNNALLFNKNLKEHTGKVVLGVGWALKNMQPPRQDMFFGLNKSRDALMEHKLGDTIEQLNAATPFIDAPYYADPQVRACLQTLFSAKVLTKLSKVLDYDAISKRYLDTSVYTWVDEKTVSDIIQMTVTPGDDSDPYAQNFRAKLNSLLQGVQLQLPQLSPLALSQLKHLCTQGSEKALGLTASINQLIHGLYEASVLHAARTRHLHFSLEGFDFTSLSEKNHQFRTSTTNIELRFLMDALEHSAVSQEKVHFYWSASSPAAYDEVREVFDQALKSPAAAL